MYLKGDSVALSFAMMNLIFGDVSDSRLFHYDSFNFGCGSNIEQVHINLYVNIHVIVQMSINKWTGCSLCCVVGPQCVSFAFMKRNNEWMTLCRKQKWHF